MLTLGVDLQNYRRRGTCMLKGGGHQFKSTLNTSPYFHIPNSPTCPSKAANAPLYQPLPSPVKIPSDLKEINQRKRREEREKREEKKERKKRRRRRKRGKRRGQHPW